MKYLCLGYYDTDVYDSLDSEARQAIGAECRPHDEAFLASGKVHSVASLEHRTHVTLRPNRGKPDVHDGPYSEAKEVVGSIFIIEAESLDEAVRIASLHPAARVGEHLGFALEVRPIERELRL